MLHGVVSRIHAVLTGDLVDSQGFAKRTGLELEAALRQVFSRTREQFSRCEPTELDVFRGDSWQFAVGQEQFAVRVALHFRACVRAELGSGGEDTRVAIGWGKIDLWPSRGRQGAGPAFTLSGRCLDEMGRYRLAGAGWPGMSEETLTALLRLLDHLVSEWTALQALAVSRALEDKTQEEIRLEWPGGMKHQSGVARHLHAAGWGAIEAALAAFEYAFKKT